MKSKPHRTKPSRRTRTKREPARRTTAAPEIVYYVACSLDGYIATTDGGVEWLEPFQGTGEDHGVVELYASVDALLMGSHTYEFALKLPQWPSPDKRSWVFTRRKLRIVHPSISLTSDEPATVVERLRAARVKRAWLMGGGKLATSFRTAGLLSRYIITVMPVVLGGGIPLFAPAATTTPLRLVKAKSFASGIVQLSYEAPE